jgi:hypothetical protein
MHFLLFSIISLLAIGHGSLLSLTQSSIDSFDDMLNDPEMGELLDMFTLLSMTLDNDPDSASPLLDHGFEFYSTSLIDPQYTMREYLDTCIPDSVFQHTFGSRITGGTTDGRLAFSNVVLHDELLILENDIASIPIELDNYFRSILESWGVSRQLENCTRESVDAIPDISISFVNGTIIFNSFDFFSLDASRNICSPKYGVNSETNEFVLLTHSLPEINVLMDDEFVLFCDSRIASYL